MKKRIISFILCVVMCCAIFPASAFAVGTDTQQGGYYQGNESPAVLELKEWQAKHPIVQQPVRNVQHEENLSPAMIRSAGFTVSPMAGTAYTDGPYAGKRDAALALTGINQRTRIVKVAQSQVGYLESDSASDLRGTVAGTGNYTEYGRQQKNNGVAWGGYFANWCAVQVGFGTPLMWLSTTTYDSSKVREGDVLVMRNGENLGIVTGFNSNRTRIYFIEGNYSNRVYQRDLPINDSTITKYASPNYNEMVKSNGYWYFQYSDGSKHTGWLESEGDWYYFDPASGGKMVIGHWTIDGKDYDFNSTGALVSGTP